MWLDYTNQSLSVTNLKGKKMKDEELQFDRKCHVLYSKSCKKQIIKKDFYAEFAKQNNITEIMPALCNGDYDAMALLNARLVRTTTCSNGCKCDYTICGDKDPYLKDPPEYRDEAGYKRNK